MTAADHRHGAGSCGCSSHRPGRWFPGNLRVIRTLIAGLQPIPTGVIGALDAAQSNGMAGRTGTVVYGEPSDPVMRFTGYLAYNATAVIAPMGSSATVRFGPNTLLPATSSEGTRSVGSVQDHLAMVIPGGWRR